MERIMKRNKDLNKKELGEKIVLSAIKMEESLSDLLRAEARLLRKKCKEGAVSEDLIRVNKMIKHVIFTLTYVDERIEKGLEMMTENIAEESIKNN